MFIAAYKKLLGPGTITLYNLPKQFTDIPLCSKIFQFKRYADDTTLLSNLGDFKTRDEMLNAELSKINMWFQLNKLINWKSDGGYI